MKANRIPRKLARKAAWAVAISTATYGVEAIWEDQKWLLKGFDKLTVTIAQAVAAKGTDAIRAADTPPTKAAFDRRMERLFTAVMAAPPDSPKKHLLPLAPEDDSSRHRIPGWFKAATDQSRRLLRQSQQVEQSAPDPRDPIPWRAL